MKAQKTLIRNTGTENELALKASFLISLRIAKSKKKFTIGEDLIMPCMVDANLTLFGDKAAKKIKTIPLFNDTVSNRITMMSDDVHQQLIRKIKRSKLYALQLDESTDITDKALLLIYIRYVDWDEKEIKEEFLNCLELKKHTTGAENFSALSDCFLSTDLKMSDCISICTDGAANMTGRHAGLVAKMKQVAPNIQSTHCMIHREMLASKRMSAEFNQVLTTAVKTVNFIKSSFLNLRLFAMLCDEMGSAHRTLLLHAEVRWLSRGRILKRLCELREEIIIFLSSKNCDLVQYFKDIDWNMKLCYLADIFQLLNELNMSLQGTQKTMFHSYSKIEGQKKKCMLWITRIENNCFEMFSTLMEFMSGVNENNEDYSITQLKLIIVNHLNMLSLKFEDYFPSNQDPRDGFLWILDPFSANSSTNTLSTNEEDMLADLSSGVTLKNLKSNSSLDKFWIEVHSEYEVLSEKALGVLLPFPSTYLCESGFSAVTATKTKYRNRLNVTPILRLSLTNLTPDIDNICSHIQAQPSH